MKHFSLICSLFHRFFLIYDVKGIDSFRFLIILKLRVKLKGAHNVKCKDHKFYHIQLYHLACLILNFYLKLLLAGQFDQSISFLRVGSKTASIPSLIKSVLKRPNELLFVLGYVKKHLLVLDLHFKTRRHPLISVYLQYLFRVRL